MDDPLETLRKAPHQIQALREEISGIRNEMLQRMETCEGKLFDLFEAVINALEEVQKCGKGEEKEKTEDSKIGGKEKELKEKEKPREKAPVLVDIFSDEEDSSSSTSKSHQNSNLEKVKSKSMAQAPEPPMSSSGDQKSIVDNNNRSRESPPVKTLTAPPSMPNVPVPKSVSIDKPTSVAGKLLLPRVLGRFQPYYARSRPDPPPLHKFIEECQRFASKPLPPPPPPNPVQVEAETLAPSPEKTIPAQTSRLPPPPWSEKVPEDDIELGANDKYENNNSSLPNISAARNTNWELDTDDEEGSSGSDVVECGSGGPGQLLKNPFHDHSKGRTFSVQDDQDIAVIDESLCVRKTHAKGSGEEVFLSKQRRLGFM